MILLCCASELGLPEDLSAIEVILYYYYYYIIGQEVYYSIGRFITLSGSYYSIGRLLHYRLVQEPS